MFRIEYLKLKDHPQLGNLELFLSEKNEIKNISKPYTSIIIGANGTGKSYILKTVADIFRQFKAYSETEKKEFNLPFDVHVRYVIHHNSYEIVTKKLDESKGSKKREYLFFKNRPIEKDFYDGKTNKIVVTGFEVLHKELEYPEKLLVNSVIPTDRFVYKNTSQGDFYQYLGVRSTSSTTSTKSSSRRIIKHLFNASSANKQFTQTLKELLHFLEFEESLNVHYSTKINKLFFSGKLKIEDFKQYFENWWDVNFGFSNRKKENPLWSVPYYKNHFKGNESATERIVEYLNQIANEPERLKHKANSVAKIISVDLFDKNTSELDLEMIRHLENLDILSLDGIKIKKSNSLLSINDVSSGEYHLLISLIGIFANISNNSLVLIDEPEISLHPNWQMRYMSFLKNVFKNYSSCQFVITTHSHFLVSDLEDESSSVTALKREVGTNRILAFLLDEDTFGRSAEEILYNVFNVKTVRNHFIEADLTDLLGLISENSKEKKQIQKLLDTIKSINISPNDPLNAVIEEANAYLKTI